MAASLPMPMLILSGGRDYQVTDADLDLWRKALGKKAGVTFKAYAGVNHLFAEGKGKATPEEYAEERHVSPAVIADVATWISAPSR